MIVRRLATLGPTSLAEASAPTMRRCAGFTLIELIAFIVVAGIVGTALIHAFGSSMRGSHFGKRLTQATQLGQQRLEVIVGQRERLGYGAFNGTTFDPCDTVGPQWGAQACSFGAFTILTSLNAASDACGAGTGTSCKLATVTVTEQGGGMVMATFNYQAWNY